jgi:hypothetical protein
MSPQALSAIMRSMQTPAGAFATEIVARDMKWPDENGFTTALVLRALHGMPRDAALEAVCSRALDFVERCASPRVPGAFGFWPADTRPAWARGVPEDLDDTAVMTIELARSGRLSRQDVLRTACKVLLANRIDTIKEPVRPPWIVPGAFRTWISQDRGVPNIVDCCVNANAVALMAYAEASHLPGFGEAIETIARGIQWAGRCPSRLRSLTPFYATPFELLEALAHAVACGASRLRGSLERLRAAIGPRDPAADTRICSSAYGETVWRCPAVLVARAWRLTASVT